MVQDTTPIHPDPRRIAANDGPVAQSTTARSDIAAAIRNVLRATGLGNEEAQLYIDAIMADPLMRRALATLQAAGERDGHAH